VTWGAGLPEHFERIAALALPDAASEPARLHTAMRYALLGGGKRIRALLAYAAGEAAGAHREAIDPIALAVECVHAYSLVHDDLPCMDDDVLRRGRPTLHVAFDEATAMLAGDALQAEAFRLVSGAPLAPDLVVALVHELAVAAGPAGMCGGQAIDLAAQGQVLGVAALEAMHLRKTGALLRACVRMGALAGPGGVALLPALDRYASAIGLAFQIVDDILDVEGSTGELGKTAGKDQAQGKATYATLLGPGPARARAEQCHREAILALEGSGLAPDRALGLHELAGRILGRRS
jgi:farnesyl diphosphate synthase